MALKNSSPPTSTKAFWYGWPLDVRRATRDIDALVRGVAGSTDELLAWVKEVATHAVDYGVVFQVDQARSRSIRDDATYPGTRVTMPVNLGPARSKFTIDISVGDPVVPAPRPVEMPLLLGGVVRLLGYPAETVLAEKIVTAISHGELSTRVRDYADVWRLTRTRDLDGRTVTEAVHATAAYRGVTLRRLSDVVGNLPEAQQVGYQRWYDRQRSHAVGYPERFRLVVTEVTAFADPVLDGSAADRRWSARAGRWQDRSQTEPTASVSTAGTDGVPSAAHL